MAHGEANIWEPRTLIEVSANTKSIEERQTAIANQTLFTLATFAYAVDTGALEVYRNGLHLTRGVDWVEQTVSTFTITKPSTVADQIVAVGHISITADVDVRDTDIFVTNFQAIRDYSGTEITLYSQGKVTHGDAGESFFAKRTGAAPGFYVDNNFDILVPTGGDGSTGWVRQDEVNVKDFGAIGDGTTDDTTAIQNALNIGKMVFVPRGNYKVLLPLTSTGASIKGEEGSVIDGANASFVGDGVIKFTGAGLTQIADLNANVAKGDISIVFATSITLVAGDIFIIANPTDSSWSGFRTTYKAGEYCEVASVSGNTVALKSPLYDSYVVANVDVFKQDSISPTVRDIEINGKVSDNVIRLDFCRDAIIKNVKSNHENNAILSEVNCYQTMIQNPSWNNYGDGGDDYGWVVSRSQHSKLIGGNIYGRRHAVTMGGGTGQGVVPVRDIRIIGTTLKNDFAAGVHNADFHGHSEDCSFNNCTIYGGATWQGKDNGYNDCTIYYKKEGVVILAAEILGGLHYAHGCRLISYLDPSDFARGIVDVGGNSLPISVNTVEDVTISLKGTTVNGANMSSITSVLVVRNRGTTKKINVMLDDMTNNLDNFGQFLFMDAISGTEDSDFIVVDNVRTALNGKKLGNISTAYKAFPMRMHELKGSEEVTTSTGSPTVNGTAVVFKYEYPEIPVITMSRSDRAYGGNRIGIAYAQPVAQTGLTPKISTDDATNFSSAVTITLNWSVGIKDI